ncbi:MAG: hypothetical protein QN167_04760 [Armatimonadota bacterium]|nr:hypothetical protein [Armatimonadota bacterium]
MAMSVTVKALGGTVAVLLLVAAVLRSDPHSERQVLAAAAPSAALISHAVKLQVFVGGEKVSEGGYVVFSGTVVKSDRTGSYLLTVAHGVDLTYLEEELNAQRVRYASRAGFRMDTDIRDLAARAKEIRSHYAGRRILIRLVWKKETRVDFQWEQAFKIPARAILVDPHEIGMDLALLHVPTKNLCPFQSAILALCVQARLCWTSGTPWGSMGCRSVGSPPCRRSGVMSRRRGGGCTPSRCRASRA